MNRFRGRYGDDNHEDERQKRPPKKRSPEHSDERSPPTDKRAAAVRTRGQRAVASGTYRTLGALVQVRQQMPPCGGHQGRQRVAIGAPGLVAWRMKSFR